MDLVSQKKPSGTTIPDKQPPVTHGPLQQICLQTLTNIMINLDLYQPRPKLDSAMQDIPQIQNINRTNISYVR